MKKFVSFILLIFYTLFSLTSCGRKNQNAMPTLEYLYNTSESHQAIGEYIQSALAAAGIRVTLSNQEWGTFLTTRKAGEYSIARNGWLADYTDPISFLDMWTSDSGNNDIGFGKGEHKNVSIYSLDLRDEGYDINVSGGTWSETYDVLIKVIKSCTDTEKRFRLMHLAEDMIMDTGCIMPLYFYTDLYMKDKSLKGFYSSPLGIKLFHNTEYKGKSSISVSLASEPSSLDPALSSTVDAGTMLSHLFSGLAKWDTDENGNAVMKKWYEMTDEDCEKILDNTTWNYADLGYFRGGGYSSRFLTDAEMPCTMIRLNLVHGLGPVMQIAEGWTVKLPYEVSDKLWKRTDYTWPCTWFAPRVTGEGAFKTAYDVMNNWGANHGAISYGHIGADIITLCSMLRIPVSMHNVPENDIFRPASFNAFGMDKEGQDYRACAAYGPMYKK